MSEAVEELEIEGPKLNVCEATLMPVADVFTYMHHNFIDVGVFRYIEKAP
ncbi:MAG: hypothetical protein QW756_03885 [Nitrososphaerota archaeon]